MWRLFIPNNDGLVCANKYRVKNTDRIYGISMEKLLLATSGIFVVYGLFNHLPKLLNKN